MTLRVGVQRCPLYRLGRGALSVRKPSQVLDDLNLLSCQRESANNPVGLWDMQTPSLFAKPT